MTSLRRERVCDLCLAAVQPETADVCTRCGEALGMESARFAAALHASECTACRLAPPAFARASSYAAYDGHLRELLHLLKFGEQRALADRVLGPWLAAAMLAASEERETGFVVVPVPMFSARERRRGFNQAALLAGAAVRHLRKTRPGLRFDLGTDVLQRHRDTGSLFALAPHQRRRSLKGAFRVRDAERLRGREVMLVDDIMTTGATARECARVLLAAGASAVLVATVARAQPEGASSHAEWTGSAVAHWDAAPVADVVAAQAVVAKDGSMRVAE